MASDDPHASPLAATDHAGGILGPQVGAGAGQPGLRSGQHDDRAVDQRVILVVGVAGRQYTSDPGQA